jgi:hypothetical protein
VSEYSELQRELQELRERERRFRAISDYTYDWESWHDLSGRLVWVNRAVERLTGCSIDECLRQPDYPLPLVAAEDRGAVSQLLADARAGGSGNDVEFRMLSQHGAVRWGAISWQPIYDDAGRSLGFRTSVREISERKRMEAQIRQYAENLEQLVAERTAEVRRLELRRTQVEKLAALGQLAAGVAHEINNPLAGIRNAFELIRTGLPREHAYHSYLDLIDSEIERISGIVHQMYQLYRPRSEGGAEFELGHCVQQVLRLVEVTARRHGVGLNVETDSQPIATRLPEGELKQILYNVILNALQASAGGGTVTVRLAARQNQVEIQVRDQGVGIAAEDLPRIFDPFFTTKPLGAGGGLGLGLSITHSLVAAMGGRLEVESTPGQGTTVAFILPQRLEEHD